MPCKFRTGRNIAPSRFKKPDSAGYNLKSYVIQGEINLKGLRYSLSSGSNTTAAASWVAKSRHNSSPSHQSGPGSCMDFMNFVMIYYLFIFWY